MSRGQRRRNDRPHHGAVVLPMVSRLATLPMQSEGFGILWMASMIRSSPVMISGLWSQFMNVVNESKHGARLSSPAIKRCKASDEREKHHRLDRRVPSPASSSTAKARRSSKPLVAPVPVGH